MYVFCTQCQVLPSCSLLGNALLFFPKNRFSQVQTLPFVFFFVSGSIAALASRSDQVRPSMTIAEGFRHGLTGVNHPVQSTSLQVRQMIRRVLVSFPPQITRKNANLKMHFVANTVCSISRLSLPKLIGPHKLSNLHFSTQMVSHQHEGSVRSSVACR